MHREDDDVFEPAPALSSAGESFLLPLDPPPGPAPEWTARGIIDQLEPLTTPERCARLRETLIHRMDSVTVLFDHPHDPHNGSAVLRSCDAFGVQRVHIVSPHEPFTASRMVAKGSDRWVDVIHHNSPAVAAQVLHDLDFQLLVTHPNGKLLPQELAQLPKVALILGNERDGVSAELTSLSDNTVRIPMRGFVESLNVSVTAGILVQAACTGREGDLSDQQRDNIYARWLRKSVPRADEVLAALEPC